MDESRDGVSGNWGEFRIEYAPSQRRANTPRKEFDYGFTEVEGEVIDYKRLESSSEERISRGEGTRESRSVCVLTKFEGETTIRVKEFECIRKPGWDIFDLPMRFMYGFWMISVGYIIFRVVLELGFAFDYAWTRFANLEHTLLRETIFEGFRYDHCSHET